MPSLATQLWDLTAIQMTNWRWSWRSTLVLSVVAPVISTLGLGVFAADGGPEALGHVLAGNLVVSLLFSTVGHVSSNFAYMRQVGMLDYLATLPVRRVVLVLATVAAFFVFSVPPVVVTLGFGAAVLGLPIHLNPWVVLVLPLIGAALSGLGALIGIAGRTPQEVGTLSTLATFLLIAIGPVIVPASKLPDIVNTVALLSPATYAASALRQVVLAMPDRIPLAVDVAVLTAIMAGLLALATRRMDWRAR